LPLLLFSVVPVQRQAPKAALPGNPSSSHLTRVYCFSRQLHDYRVDGLLPTRSHPPSAAPSTSVWCTFFPPPVGTTRQPIFPGALRLFFDNQLDFGSPVFPPRTPRLFLVSLSVLSLFHIPCLGPTSRGADRFIAPPLEHVSSLFYVLFCVPGPALLPIRYGYRPLPPPQSKQFAVGLSPEPYKTGRTFGVTIPNFVTALPIPLVPIPHPVATLTEQSVLRGSPH